MTQALISNTFHLFRSLGLAGSFLSMFIENVGIPIPTEVGYLIGQELINNGFHNYYVVLTVLTLGHVSGAIVSYRIGRWGDSYVTKKLQRSRKIIEVHEKLQGWYKKYGNLTVFITRFVGYVRPWSSYVAGFAKVPFWPFVIWTSLGSLLFNIVALYFTGILLLVWRQYTNYHFGIIFLMLVLFFGLIIYEVAKHWLVKKRPTN